MSNKSKITVEQCLEFEVAFPEEKPLTIEQYLSGGKRSIILKVAVFLLGFKDHSSKYAKNREFLGMFFSKENEKFANEVFDRINELEKKSIPVSIINAYSSLKLFEYYFSKPEEPEGQTNAEFEVNLFKAYLVLNSEFIKKQNVAIPSAQKIDMELHIPMMTFSLQYPLSDKTNYDIKQVWVSQIIKSIYLFQFLESHERTQILLAKFLEYFECSTWQEYLKTLLSLTMSTIQDEKEAHTDIIVKPDENFEKGCAFIEKFIIHDRDELDQNDFLTVRAKPFYKIGEGKYRIIYKLFVVEKIFKGAYFLLRDVNKTLPKENRIKEIRSFYGDEFSEKVLCYKAIESIYSDKCIRFSGKELANRKIDAAPDYYVRRGKNILLIESKDFLIAADKKMSFDFNVYEEEFGRVLDYEEMPNGKRKPKAVMQLINFISRILRKEFSADTDYQYKDIFIYPILLTHDQQYDTPGFNELIDFWFQDALLYLQEEGLFIHHVKPLSVVNIDSIIFNQVGLADDISLHEVLNLYHENKKVKKQNQKNFKTQKEYDKYLEENTQMKISKLIPFDFFINKYFRNNGLWMLPPFLEMVIPSLSKEVSGKLEKIKHDRTTKAKTSG